jgi:hypothetical protein
MTLQLVETCSHIFTVYNIIHLVVSMTKMNYFVTCTTQRDV